MIKRCISLVLFAVVATAGCSDAGDRTLEGIVIHVEARSLEDIRSFTLRTEGREYEIFLRDGEDYAFPPQHLREHVISAEPVAVGIEEEGDRLIAVTLDDA